MVYLIDIDPIDIDTNVFDKIIFTSEPHSGIDLDNYHKTIDYQNFSVYTRKEIVETVTFIVQGRILDPDLFQKNLINLSRYGHVIVSLTKDSIESFVTRNKIINEQNVYLQVHSTLDGLKKSITSFSIKVRADEYYQNWEPFINKMTGEPDKIITNNVFFRKVERYPFHISDHIIGGLTSNLLKMFQNTKQNLETRRIPPHVTKGIPEQWLTIGFLLSTYTEEKLRLIKGPQKIREVMQNHFHFIKVEDFQDFVISYTKNGRCKRIRQRVNGPLDLKNHQIIDVTINF